MTEDRLATPARTRRRATRPAGPPTQPAAAPAPEPPATRRAWSGPLAAAVALVIAVAMACGMWFVKHRAESRDALRDQYVETARQMALNVETFNPDTADADTQRILAGASGQLAKGLAGGLNPLAKVLQQMNASGQGKILEAGLEAIHGDDATVLVASDLTLHDKTGGSSTESLRLRLTVHNDDGAMTVTNLDAL